MKFYLVMDRFEAQVIAAACSLAKQDWSKGDDYAKKMADICNDAEIELIREILTQKPRVSK